jgi:biopolymer transport protein ExbB
MSFLLQVDTLSQTAAQVAENAVTKEEVSLISIIFSGGPVGIVIMSAIFIMLFFAIYLYFERLWAIKAASKMDQNFMTQIKM